jgi:uncharacterized protein
MPHDWSKLRDIGPLADTRAGFDVEVPLAEFPRLSPLLADPEGCAQGRLRFERADGLAMADVDLTARVTLRCQRCLAPVRVSVRSSGRVALVADAAEADRAGEEVETVLAPEHRLSLRDLLEEELLLSLPLVARHEPPCEAPSTGDADPAPVEPVGLSDAGAAADRQRPFAELKHLLAQSRTPEDENDRGERPQGDKGASPQLNRSAPAGKSPRRGS